VPGARSTWLAAAALLLAVGLAFGGVASAGFMWLDDALYVTHNAEVLAGLTRHGLAWAFGAGEARDTYFHALTWLSLMADVELFGPNPVALHLENLALHALTAVLLFLLLLRATGRRGPALAAALLFALHPLTVEPVAWIVERKTVLATALGLGSALTWVTHLSRPSAWRVALSALLLGLSLLAKPHLVVLPALLLVLDLWPLGRLPLRGAPSGGFAPAPWPRLILEKWPLWTAAAGGAALVLGSLPRSTDAGEAPRPVLLRLANAVARMADYTGAAAWPHDLTMLRIFPTSVPAGQVAAGAAVLVLLSAGALLLVRRRPWLLAGWLWFLVALAPASGLLQSGLWPAWADRFAYVPLMGLAFAAAFEGAAWADRSPRARPVVLLVGAAGLLALGVVTRAQVEQWQSSVKLYERAAAQSPGSALVRASYAATLYNEHRYGEALAQASAAVALDPGYGLAHLRAAEAAHELGRVEAAAAAYRAALAIDPLDPDAHFGLGYLAWQRGWSDVAAFHLQRFLEVEVPDARGRERWARAWLEGIAASPPGTPEAKR
jgi:tetratricopeptide (TPR) repeat protein